MGGEQIMIISVANSRKSKLWSKQELTWSEFVESLRKPIVTDETQEEYFNMSKAQQDEIKDVGGFVGGELKDGRRKSDHVINRCILTLDADYANKDFNDYIEMFFDSSYCIYSTHKHTKENPRYRLIIPLSRTCDAEEYEAVARMVASQLDVNIFDDTTYQPHRLMYYPSVSKDGEYIFYTNDTKPLDVDKILSLYTDWKDRSQWPVSDRESTKIRVYKNRQQDPREKQGLIGAFCRAYDVHEVIQEHLSDVYEPCGDNRYTYINGSTHGGVLVYDDGLSTYSNHATDPTCSKLCNAFDLVRIHKFSHLDEGYDIKSRMDYLPSFRVMLRFVSRDKKIGLESEEFMKKPSVRIKKIDSTCNVTCNTKECGFERIRKFVTCAIEKRKVSREIEEEEEWKNELIYNKKGIIMQSIANAELIMRCDKKLKNKFGFDTFTKKIWVLGDLPWNKSKEKRQWRDVDDSRLRLYLEKTYGITHRNNIYDAWQSVIEYNSFNPVMDYLKSLKHDGIKRLDTLFIDYLGVDDNIYSREATRKSLVGAVARVFEPGVKLDTSIVLVGSQGVGKSQIVHKLGKEWFSDSLVTVKGKEAYEQIQGFWIIEIAELAAMKKVEIEAIKHFMSKREDSFRGAYARNVETHKRQCIFICTTNTYDCLRDVTGGRRFYPLDVDKSRVKKDIWKDLNNYEIDQVWAEAVVLYKAGEKLILSKEAKEIAEKEQESHTEYNPIEGVINEYLDMPVPDDWYDKDIYDRINYIRNGKKVGKPRDKICVLEIWCEALEADRKELTQQKSREIANLLIKNKKWVKIDSRRFGYLYGNQRAYKRN